MAQLKSDAGSLILPVLSLLATAIAKMTELAIISADFNGETVVFEYRIGVYLERDAQMERVAHGLSCTAHVAGNYRRTLASMGSQQYLAPAKGKGSRRAQSSFSSCLLGWNQGAHREGGVHALILPFFTLLSGTTPLPFVFSGFSPLSEPQKLDTLLIDQQFSVLRHRCEKGDVL